MAASLARVVPRVTRGAEVRTLGGSRSVGSDELLRCSKCGTVHKLARAAAPIARTA